ncbi:MAG: MATE family efflux transporter, partial [Bacilli bacterium]
MKQTTSITEKWRQFFVILIPILITQVGLFSMTFFDTTMSGQASPADVAGVAIGASLWTPIFTGFGGILNAITPIVSTSFGAKDPTDVRRTVQQGLIVSALIGLAIIIVAYFVIDPILNGMRLEAEVHRIANDYLFALLWGIIALFLYQVLRNFMDALGYTRTTMFITLISLPINVIINYALIFGQFGFPKLGGVGAGYATAITYWIGLILAVIFITTNKTLRAYQVLGLPKRIIFSKWKEILMLGFPIGCAIFFETSVFSGVTLLMSNFDTVTIASHQSALNFASLLYMIPLSIAIALTILIGFEVGARRYEDARKYAWIGLSFAVGFSFVNSAIIYFGREVIASFYTQDPEVLALTSQFLIYGVFYQLCDALLAPTQGALRGYK